MRLILTVLRCPPEVVPETRTVTGGEFTVGRGPGVDWVLADPDQMVSRRHFSVEFRAGTWQLIDESSNGTFANRDEAPVGKGNQRTLRDHDRLRVGPYELEVELQEDDALGQGGSYGFGGMSAGGFGGAPSGGFSGTIPDDGFDEPFAEALRPLDAAPSFGTPFGGRTQSDHSSVLDDAMRPPMPVGHMPPGAGGAIPPGDLLSDDWEKDLLEGINTPASTAAPAAPKGPDPVVPPHRQAPPPSPARPDPFAEPAAPASAMPDPFAETAAAPSRAVPGETPHSAVPPSPAMPDPFAEPATPARAAAPSHPMTPDPFAEPVLPTRAAAPSRPVTPDPFAGPAAAARAAVPSAVPDPFAEPADPPRAVASAFAGPVAPSREVPDPFAEPTAPPYAVADPFAEPVVPPAGPHAAARAAVPPPVTPDPFAEPAVPSRPLPDSFAAPAATPPAAAPAPPPPAAAPSAPAAADAGLMTAFMAGVGLPDARPADPSATLLRLGEAFRALVSGLRAVLIARASIKSEFRIEQTMIRSRGNNPLKFSADDDDAVSALLGVGRRIDMTPAAAVTDSLRDIRLHEVATMAAMQSAVRTLLDTLHPDRIRATAEQGGGMSLLTAQKKARAWDIYEAQHARTVQALSDDFDSVFGKAFARAYEDALKDLMAKEKK